MELFGYTRETFVEHIDSFSRALHPDDRPRVEAAIERAVNPAATTRRTTASYTTTGRPLGRGARTRALRPDGRPVRMLGAAYDTTGVHSAAERLGRVLETMSTAFLTLDRYVEFTYVNAAAERIFAARRDELVGRAIWDIYPELVGTETSAARAALEGGEP